LVDAALDQLGGYMDIGYQVNVGGNALTASSSDTTLTLTDATRVNTTDVIEFGWELCLVTAKSSDATPIVTVTRGYDRTTPAAHASDSVGYVNPQFSRRRVASAITRSFSRLDAAGVFPVQSGTYERTTDLKYVTLPANTRDVLSVRYWGVDGHFYPVDEYRFIDDVPTAKISTGKALNVPRYVINGDDLEVTTRIPYRWSSYPSDPTADSTITLVEGAEDLPSLYAAAWLIEGRELNRLQLDKSVEWQNTAQVQGGTPVGMVRQMWGEFYKALDDAKRLYVPDIPRPFIRKRRFL
jgi:hypothetical protein